MTKPKSNSYDDDDMKQVLEEIEGLKNEQVAIRAEAAGRCGGISKKIGNAKGRAKDLGIPLTILNGLLKTRDLERQMDKIAEAIPDDFAEVWVDAAGQFSLFALEDGDEEAPVVNAAQSAATKRQTAAEANQAREQNEGTDALSVLTSVSKH